MQQVDSVIIGGGVTGLSLAHRLMLAGREVVVLEPGNPGGLVKTKKVDGFNLELGPNVFVDKPELLDLITKVGLAQDIVYAPEGYKQFVWYKGKATLVPKSPPAALKSNLISLWDKACLPMRAVRKGVLRPHAEDESIRQFLTRGLGKSPVNRIVAPVLQGIFGGDLDKLSARSVLPEFWRHAIEENNLVSFAKGKQKKRAFVLRNGADSLTRALAEQLRGNAQLRADKAKTLRRGSGGSARFEVELETGDKLSAYRIYVATSGAATASYCSGLDADFAGALANVGYAQIVVVHVAVDRHEKLPELAFGVLFPPGEDSGLLGIMYNSLLFPHVAPTGKYLLTVCLGGVHSTDIISKSDDELKTAACNAVINKLNFTSAKALNVQRWERAIPQYELGHFQIVKRMREMEQRFPGLKFLGADVGGVGVPDRVKAAFEVE